MRFRLAGLVGLGASLLACAFLQSESTPVPPQPLSVPPTALSPAPLPTASPQAVMENPSGAGKWDLWANGAQLRGANVYQRRVFAELDGEEFMGPGPFGPPYTQEDFDRLSALGANYVNISHAGLFTVEPPYLLDQQAVANLDHLLEMIARADMFAVITFRSGPGRSEFSILRDGAGDWYDEKYLVETVWEDEQARQAWAAMWRFTAEHYHANPIVTGFDLMCEPNSNDIVGIWDAQVFDARYAGSGYDWAAWYPNLVAAIREVDAEIPILVGGNGYSNTDWLPYLKPVSDARVVYTIHQYSPHEYTHQEPPDLWRAYPGVFDVDYDGDDDTFDRKWLEDWLEIPAAFSRQQGAPLAANEYGVMRWEPGAADFMRDQMALFEQHGWNYALWAWEASWKPMAESVTDFNFRFGPGLDSVTDTGNDLLAEITGFWARNTVRPSNYSP